MCVTVSDFSSLFEVSIAIHLLYSLIPQVQRAYLAHINLVYRYLQRSIDGFERRRTAMNNRHSKAWADEKDRHVDHHFGSMTPGEQELIRERREKRNSESREMDKLFRRIESHRTGYHSSMLTLDKIAVEKSQLYIPKAIGVSFFSLILLIVSGFWPDQKIYWLAMVFLIAMTIFPMPTMLYLTYRRSKREMEEVEKEVNALWGLVQRFSMGDRS